MEDDIPYRTRWIEVGYGDLWEDCCESFDSTKLNGPWQWLQNHPRGRAPSARHLERRLRRAARRGNATLVTELLRGGGGPTGGLPGWSPKTLRNALKCAADSATVAAFASTLPDFFHSDGGASTTIFIALKSGNEETVRLLLAAGVSPDAGSSMVRDGTRALHWACAWGRAYATEALLQAGADAMACADRGLTPLHIAANLGHVSCVEALLSAGAEVDAVDAMGTTALHHAAWDGRFACVSALLEAGTAVDARCHEGRTPLLLLAHGHRGFYLPSHLQGRSGDRGRDDHYLQCCELLLSCGANVRAVDNHGVSSLCYAMHRRQVELIGVLTLAGANIADRFHGETALHAAAAAPFGRSQPIIEMLVALGLDVNARTSDGCTPLHRAVGQGKLEAVQTLLRLNADMTLESSMGYSPIFFAASLGFCGGVQAMLEAGADLARRASGGLTLLHAAVSSSRAMMELLVTAGADPNARADDGRTPLHCAASGWNSAKCLDFLQELGANLQARDNRGWTATHFAASHGSTDSLRWLLARADSEPALHDVLGVSASTENGSTPLHLAASAAELYAVKCLLEMGASVAYIDNAGRTALHEAAHGTCEDTLCELLESSRGGDRLREMRDFNGDTAADMAHVGSLRCRLEQWSLAG